MKKIYYILSFILLTASLSSCRWEQREDAQENAVVQMPLSDLLCSYDLWYVDIDQTQGTGNITFVSRAFTMSFMSDGQVFANNNIVGLGQTGNGFGINTGVYDVYNRSGILSIHDDVFGSADFEVTQLSLNEISLYNRAQNVTYFLVGYQKYNFDYDRLFYENITYYLQEYEAWTKTGENIVTPQAPFIEENHLTFYVDNDTNVFDSSVSPSNIPILDIYWDYSGDYDVQNTSVENVKDLLLTYYGNNGSENFDLDVVDDETIILTNIQTGNSFTYKGRNYIQYKTGAKRLKHKIPKNWDVKHYRLMK